MDKPKLDVRRVSAARKAAEVDALKAAVPIGLVAGKQELFQDIILSLKHRTRLGILSARWLRISRAASLFSGLSEQRRRQWQQVCYALSLTPLIC